MSQDENVRTIASLGLTVLQAKVYLALVALSNTTGRAAAKEAKVASQDVYRVLSELQEKGLVEKIIDKPNRYRPIPLKEGVSMLLQRRAKETAELEKATAEICKNFQNIDKNEYKSENNEFILIPEKEAVLSKFWRNIESAQISLDLMNDFQEGIDGHEALFELEMKAIDRGVKIRDILYNPKKTNKTNSLSKLLKRKPAFQTKTAQFPLPIKVTIKDRKEVLISTRMEVNTKTQPYLWSNNPLLVQIIQNWYDMMWEKAEEIM